MGKEQVIERYLDQTTPHLERIEAKLDELRAEITKMREVIESALQMVMVTYEER